MTNADKVTFSRIVLAPCFFVLYRYSPFGSLLTIILLWTLFGAIEISDFVDGRVARAERKVSSFGKLFDPFADVVARITYFVCFTLDGVMPPFVLIIILYREFGMLFLRMLLSLRGIAMGARAGGKLKSGFYMVSGLLSLLLVSLSRLGWWSSISSVLKLPVFLAYVLAGFLSIASFIDYLLQYRKLTTPKP
ncbi:MAG: CDP-diacylglycerol--glycerol-3-phosphate 3-phosphatidyltransferase [Spirochaetes bacterium]|nr:CDP-diacylglycerol--glycerol-3-phosphate 3-phosphatidyltransferase [Spirochaetota bacterium]